MQLNVAKLSLPPYISSIVYSWLHVCVWLWGRRAGGSRSLADECGFYHAATVLALTLAILTRSGRRDAHGLHAASAAAAAAAGFARRVSCVWPAPQSPSLQAELATALVNAYAITDKRGNRSAAFWRRRRRPFPREIVVVVHDNRARFSRRRE